MAPRISSSIKTGQRYLHLNGALGQFMPWLGRSVRRIRIFRVASDWRRNKWRSHHEDEPQPLFNVTSAIFISFAFS
jgi:hypothetical protein